MFLKQQIGQEKPDMPCEVYEMCVQLTDQPNEKLQVDMPLKWRGAILSSASSTPFRMKLQYCAEVGAYQKVLQEHL